MVEYNSCNHIWAHTGQLSSSGRSHKHWTCCDAFETKHENWNIKEGKSGVGCRCRLCGLMRTGTNRTSGGFFGSILKHVNG